MALAYYREHPKCRFFMYRTPSNLADYKVSAPFFSKAELLECHASAIGNWPPSVYVDIPLVRDNSKYESSLLESSSSSASRLSVTSSTHANASLCNANMKLEEEEEMNTQSQDVHHCDMMSEDDREEEMEVAAMLIKREAVSPTLVKQESVSPVFMKEETFSPIFVKEETFSPVFIKAESTF
jgi:hypothetical protein